MEASRVICTNCIVIVVPKTFKELISIVLEVRSIVVMICRYECFIGGSYNIIIVRLTGKNLQLTFFQLHWEIKVRVSILLYRHIKIGIIRRFSIT